MKILYLLSGDLIFDGVYSFFLGVCCSSIGSLILHVSVVVGTGIVDVVLVSEVDLESGRGMGVNADSVFVGVSFSSGVGVVGREEGLERGLLIVIFGVLVESFGLHLHVFELFVSDSIELWSLSDSVMEQHLDWVVDSEVDWECLEPQSVHLPSTMATYRGERLELVALLKIVCVLSQKGKSLLC